MAVTPTALTLVSHDLCPYVQRAAIALAEKGVPYDRRWVDLAAKPDWFRAVSPLGKVPLLLVGDAVLFESAAIVEFVDETTPGRLHPSDPIERARHRAWIEVASTVLSAIAGAYSAPDAAGLEAKLAEIRRRFETIEAALGDGPWFAGAAFSLVDAAFAPVFRYFDAFDRIRPFGVFDGLPRVGRWRAELAGRPSVQAAAVPDYSERLWRFLQARRSHLATLM